MNNNNEVSNPEIQVPKTDEMNDCDYLNDILTTEKNMSNNYSVVVNEASNRELYLILMQFLSESKDICRDLFDLLFKNGWYKLEKAEQQKINTVIQEYNQKLDELN